MLIKEIPLRKSTNRSVTRRAYTYAHYYIHEEPLLSKFGKQKFWKEFVYLFLISDITIRWANCKVWRCVNYLLHCWRSLGSLQHILKSPHVHLLIAAASKCTGLSKGPPRSVSFNGKMHRFAMHVYHIYQIGLVIGMRHISHFKLSPASFLI